MKKLISLSAALMLAVLTVAIVHADNFVNFPGGYGSTMLLENHNILGVGRYAGSNAWIATPFITDVNTSYAQPMVVTSNTTNGISVSGTTTVGDKSVIGFAVFPSGYTYQCVTCSTYSALATNKVYVATSGVIGAYVGVNVTKGDLLITSGNPLYLTETAAGTPGGGYSQLSGTAVVAMALQTISMGTATSATCQVLILK
jgi:hypothetical protein